MISRFLKNLGVPGSVVYLYELRCKLEKSIHFLNQEVLMIFISLLFRQPMETFSASPYRSI